MTRITLALTIVLGTTVAVAQEPLWQADFVEANAGFSTYHDEGSPVAVTELEEEGRRLVRAQAPGEQKLEGLRISTAPVLPGGRRCTIRAEVRGSGDVWLIAHSRNGWLYSRETAALTDQWREIELTKPLALGDDRMSICMVTREAAPMILEVRSLTVSLEPAPTTWDVAVAPVRIEAEELSAYEEHVAQVEGASGGAVVRGRGFALLTGIPCPRTSRPIHVFARARMPDEETYWSVIADTGAGAQRVNQMFGEDTPDWQWIGGEPFTPAMVGDSFRLQLYGSRQGPGDAQLDDIVITTEPDPTPEQLQGARRLSLAARPSVTIGRAAEPPTLDGMAEEECWRSAVALTGFTRTSSTVPARQPSQVRLCWDEENLYWWFRGDEPVLRPEMNRLHDFRQSVTERDGRVWDDDCAMLILDTGDGIFDMFVNAPGTVNDARIPDPGSMWSSRDDSFDARVQSASEVGDGFWTLEARVSLASLGVPPPGPGDSWRFIAGRIEQADDEASAWNLCSPGLHDPAAFADLRFSSATPGAVITVPEPLQPGGNEVRCAPSAGEGGVLLGASVRHNGTESRHWAFGEAGGEAAAPLPIESEGEVAFGYALLDAATLEPLVVSPIYTRSVRSSVAEVTLATQSPYRLLVNGRVAASGASAERDGPIEVSLHKGVNAFAVELEGAAEIRIAAGDLVITGSDPWRVAPDDVADASTPELDPREWEVAPRREGEANARIGPGRLRFEILWEDTRIFPNSQPALYVCRGTSQHVTVVARGLPGHLLEGYRCHLWLPEGLKAEAVTGYYASGVEWLGEYAIERIGDVEIEGRPHVHYVVSADQPIRYRDSVRILELFNVFLAWDAGAEPEHRDYPVYYAAEALGGSIREARQHFTVRPLPALDGRQPQRLVWQLWGSFFSAMNKTRGKELSIQAMSAAGFNNLVSGDRETSEMGDAHGVDNVLSINFESWSIDMRPWLEEHPDAALIDRDGEASELYACPSAVLDEAWPYVDERLKAKIAERRADWVTWDFESGVMTGYLSCFCPRCLAAFREHAGIGEDVELSAEVIERDLLPQWTEFMNLRMARLARRFKDACHAAEPPARLQVYSGYQSDDTKWRYGVDWAMIGELQACDAASCGYGRRWEYVRDTHEALRGIPLIVGRHVRPSDRSSDDVLTPCTRAVLLRRLMDCTGGILVYDRMPMEGRSWQASAEVSRLAAAHEDLFAEGEFVQLEGVPEGADWAGARRQGDTMIVALMNGSTRPQSLSLTLPAGYAQCVEFFTGEPAAAGSQVAVELDGGDARAWVLSRE
ncbi:MAG: hypothetical protein U9R79_05015 [Armatimonadota bacterium]|nr:hypothetical protein [Armatimonadota bacterium]